MSTIAQLVADISTAPAPVIFLDTCAILDIARAPRTQSDSVSAAETLVRLTSQSPPTTHLLIADIVTTEWNDNISSARADTIRAVSTYEQVALVSASTGIAPHPMSLSGLPSDLEGRSRTLLQVCRAIDRDASAANEAFNRVVAKRRPSHKGAVKDAYILEHCLALARGLGGARFARWLLFVSSNTSDFAAPGSPAVHSDLATDFVASGLRYATTIASAVAQLRAAGQIP